MAGDTTGAGERQGGAERPQGTPDRGRPGIERESHEKNLFVPYAIALQTLLFLPLKPRYDNLLNGLSLTAVDVRGSPRGDADARAP